jgi:uncharacterized protein (DUF2147 family)
VPVAQEDEAQRVNPEVRSRRMADWGRRTMRWIAGAAMMLSLASPRLGAQGSGVLGDWRDPTGSVIHIGACGAEVCLWITFLSPAAPSTTDIHNPDPGERGRTLCGLKIGSGFTLRDPDRAAGGTLYDPKTGKTYRGGMTAAGSKLELRGYVGIPLFGESQTWTRTTEPQKPCAGAGQER